MARNRTRTNPNQPNRRTSLLNAVGGRALRTAIPGGGVFGPLVSRGRRRSPELGTVSIDAAAPTQEPALATPAAPPTIPGTDGVPFRNQQQMDRFQADTAAGVPVGAAVAPRAAQVPQQPVIPTQPGAPMAGGLPVGLVGETGAAEAFGIPQQPVAQPQFRALEEERALGQLPLAEREEALQQRIDELISTQNLQIADIEATGGRRGIIRPFATGVEGAIRRQAAAEIEPLQTELTRTQQQRAAEEAARARATGGQAAGLAEGGTGSTTANEVVRLVNKLKGSPALRRATGIRSVIPARPGSAKFDFNRDFERLQSLLTVENLDLMKGVLTDKDIRILQSAATTLDRGLSTDAFVDELNRVAAISAPTAPTGATGGFGGVDPAFLEQLSDAQLQELQAEGLI